MSSRLSAAELEKMLALARADEAKVAVDPLVAKAQEEVLKGEKATEKARKLLAYAKLGPTGTITDEKTREKTDLLIKALATTSEFLSSTSTQVGGAWLAPSKAKMTEFLQALEALHNSTISAVIELLHDFDLGNHREGVNANIACLEEASNKRKRLFDEAATAPVGCRCRKSPLCGGRCPCSKAGVFCNEDCACCLQVCNNPFGCQPKARQRNRPSVPSEHPLRRKVVKPTHHNMSNISNTPTEFLAG